MAEPINIIDAEFQATGDDKIDFKSILFKQVDYIRFLRTQDMGEYTLIDLSGININSLTSEQSMNWLKNSAVFQNAVKSLQNMMVTYEDDKYKTALKSIQKDYMTKNVELNNKLVSNYNKYKGLTKEKSENILKEHTLIKTLHKIKFKPQEYDDIFRETLLLMGRAKFIGGFDVMGEKS